MNTLLWLSLKAIAQQPTDFEPDELLRDRVAVSTKVVQPAIETPASVSVITRDQIARAGYRSVAEALASVPGFYVSYDLVNYNVAVRGAIGGARGGGRLLKVMIDSVPVPFAQSETYFLGPEFVPITAIERIEVLRGPASSLYGAGAYTGAVNIVTRQEPYEGRVTVGGELRGYYGVSAVDGPGGDGTLQITSRTTNILLGAAGALEDRSGLTYPAPDQFDDETLAAWLNLRRGSLGERALVSSDDHATPVVTFGRLVQAVAAGRLSVFGIAQLSQRDAEFSDLSVLSNDTRSALANWKIAAAYERPFGKGFSTTARVATSGGKSLDADRLQIPGESFYYDRTLSYRNVSGSTELRYDFENLGFVLVGADALYDDQSLPDINGVTLETEEIQDLNQPVDTTLTNIAGYTQAVYPLTPGVALAAGGRFDLFRSTPSVETVDPLSYRQANGRIALNLDHRNRIALKLIGGTAFKAASPEQLYVANPIPNDIEGDPSILPQKLFGAEAVLEGYPSKVVLLSTSFFANQYRDTIGYQLVAGDQLATSYDANNIGGEATLRLTPPIPEVGFVDSQLSLSVQNTATVAAQEAATTDPFSLGNGQNFPDNEAVPTLLTYARIGLVLDRYKSSLVVEHRHIGERTPSQSNLLRCTIVNMGSPCYSLPAYDAIDATLATTPIPLGVVKLRALAKVSNVLDTRYLEVGFNGVDIPGLGRTFWFRLDLLL